MQKAMAVGCGLIRDEASRPCQLTGRQREQLNTARLLDRSPWDGESQRRVRVWGDEGDRRLGQAEDKGRCLKKNLSEDLAKCGLRVSCASGATDIWRERGRRLRLDMKVE